MNISYLLRGIVAILCTIIIIINKCSSQHIANDQIPPGGQSSIISIIPVESDTKALASIDIPAAPQNPSIELTGENSEAARTVAGDEAHQLPLSPPQPPNDPLTITRLLSPNKPLIEGTAVVSVANPELSPEVTLDTSSTSADSLAQSSHDHHHINQMVSLPIGSINVTAVKSDTKVNITSANYLKKNYYYYLVSGQSLRYQKIGDNMAADQDTQESASELLPSQEDILSSEFEVAEFACDLNDSRNAAIYCQGDLLHAVMMLGLFNDSKTFVDKPLKMDPDQVLARFKERFPHAISVEHRQQVREFVEQHFDEEGKELELCDLVDWKEEPQKLLTIHDESLRQFALTLNSMWKKLCRTIKKEVNEQPERFSLLYVPNEFIIPGGRFREFYYWDTYWVIKGLLASGMQETTRRMIGNFQYLIEHNGFVPNGGRIYYMRRSQPPMFIPMVYEYHTATKDDQFLLNAIDAMEKEMEFWKSKRTVTVRKNNRNYTLFRYRADSNVPRPESYREDYETSKQVTRDKRRQLWRDIASAAESGWDFSSRWMADRQTMYTIETSAIAPVDLNALMCWNMAILAHLHGRIGHYERRAELFRERNEFVDTFTEVFFDSKEGVWFDVKIINGEWEHDAYPSVSVPLFTECYHRLDERMMIDVLDTLERYGYLGYPGGIPTSLKKGTNQQWDYPNGWAPINHMLIEGLRKSTHYSMQQKAFEIAKKWINRNYEAYLMDNKMWEKYDVTGTKIKHADGGEYETQAGFGWTNGVALDLMVTYGKLLQVNNIPIRRPYGEYLWYSPFSAASSMNNFVTQQSVFFLSFALIFKRLIL